MLKTIHSYLKLSAVLLLLLAQSNTISAQLNASFVADTTTGCSPLAVQFTSTSTGAVRYYWDLGNGNSSTLPNPSNLYTSAGSYTVTLIVYDSQNRSDTMRRVNYITVTPKPTAAFSANILSACPGTTPISFTNSSSGAVSYLWDFGDGTTSTLANPSHVYNQSGRMSVTLIATNSLGCQDIQTISQYITIFPQPDATISSTTTSSCDPTTPFQFSNNANALSWLWNFGDGSTSNQQNPSHTYSNSGNYTVTLSVTNSFGCTNRDTLAQPIVIGTRGWSNFTSSDTTGCAPQSISFYNPNAGLASSFWDFGDGSTSTQATPNHTYVLPGTYTVTLVVTTTSGCVDTIRKTNYITLGIRPEPSFTFTPNSGCGPLTVSFTNTSTNFVSCQWWFGDGTTSTDINPVHTYTAGGVFSVTLKCWGANGCVKNVTIRNIITVTTTQAIFNGSPRVGCPPLTTNFNALTPTSGVNFEWHFGDGTTSTLQNPTHTYNTAGTFDVMLIVSDSLGCTDTIVKNDYVQTVNPAANYTPPPVTNGCAPLTAQFTDATIGASGWIWDFGDGTTSTAQNPVHTYTTPGTYTVSLTTSAAGGGCSQTISNFSTFQVNGGYAGFTHTVNDCPPYIATFQDTSLNAVSWFWDFGDGQTSTQQNPSHTFSAPGYHSVSLTITTADGCTYTTMQSNSVHFQPFGANFYGVTLDTVFPARVQFYANSVGATGWLWDFGDGNSSTLQNPLHIYQTNGNYNVTLTITNGLCTLYYDPPPFDFGTPDSSAINTGNQGVPEVQRGCIPLSVMFTNRIPNTQFWTWDFGDGNTSNVQFPQHVYTEPGIYTVTLTATDTLGIVQVLQMDSIVYASGPTAGFNINQIASCTSTQVVLADTSQNSNYWEYNFGDGTISNLQNPSHTYTTGMPNYIITQTVTDTMGCRASISTSIFANFVSPIIASETEVCGQDTIEFYTSLQNYPSYLWDFGDGTTSTLSSPTHVYTTEGTFSVSLTVTDLAGCTQVFHTPDITVSLPVANFTTNNPRQGCNALSIGFINTSVNADYYQWDLGDGTITAVENPIWRYTQAGTYDVTLTVYRGNCVSVKTMPQYLRVDTPYAAFNVSFDQICFPATATFTDQSANPVSWRWYFGNGDSSSVQHPTYVYTSRPAEFPRLIMTDVNGCVDTASVNNYPFLQAKFTTDVDSGCYPLTVNFTNQSSLIATYWLWDFGDGDTSSLQNPSHTYTQPGDYTIRLVIGSRWTNCADTLTMVARIKVKQPRPAFTSADTTACAPSLVNFTNLSLDADQYYWDFGDSTSSTNANPSHIYNSPGIYTVTLIATSDLGCSDTITMPQFIKVMGPITNFTASATEGCDPFTVNFTDHSINAVSWNWNFGDGYASTTIHATHTYTDTGSFTVSLVTLDTAGCMSYYELPQDVIVHPSPDAEFTTSTFRGCAPYTGVFTNTSQQQLQYLWNFGDGNTSTSPNASHTFTIPGNYTIELIATNNFGCTDTARSPQPLEILSTPSATFSVSDQAGCSPLHVLFSNGSTNLEGPSYQWNFGNGTTSTDPNPTGIFNQPGFYSVSLTVTNQNGCASSYTFPTLIQVYDTLPPNETTIYSVSVLSNTSVEIIWQNNPAIDLAAYVLYRKDQNSNVYRAIYTETNINNTGFALTSSYTDTGLNTLVNTYTYKVQAIDICGYTIPLDLLQAHTTVNISSQRADEDIFVSWTPYGGCPVATYELYRAAPGEPFTYLATLPGDSLSYLDTTFNCPIAYTYRVMATDLCGNTYTSYSDTSTTIPLNIFDGQIVDIVRSTVVDNEYVLTEWKQPTVHPEKVAKFDIYRSTDNSNFSYLTSVPPMQTDYIDRRVDVQNVHYYYKVLVVNTCNIANALSNNTSTIIIRGEMNEARQVHLEWTPYIGWENGVEYYILEKQDENGNWQFLKQVDGTVRWYDYQE